MTATSWWVLVNFEQHGPWPESHVLNAAAAGHLGPESLVWCAGMPEWAPLRTTALGQRLFQAHVAPPQAPAPTVPSAAPAAPVTRPVAPVTRPNSPLAAEPLDAHDIANLLDALDAEATVAGADDASHPAGQAETEVPTTAQTRVDPTATCPYCHTSFGTEAARVCPTCAAPHHADCWQELTGCAVVGCGSAPDGDAAASPQHPVPATNAYVVNAVPGVSAGWTSSGPLPGPDVPRGNW